MPDALAVVVVAYRSAGQLQALHESLTAQVRATDEIVVVDNCSPDGSGEVARSLGVRVITASRNLGFAGGCELGARLTTAPLLLFLNPDSQLAPGCLEELRRAAVRQPGWTAWQALVTLEDGRVNSDGGVVHYLGMGWAGGYGAPLSGASDTEREVTFASGAALVVRRSAWERIGGMREEYFMYGEDLELGLRIWLTGGRVGIASGARVIHSYEFDKGQMKWFWLERNRWRTVLTLYPTALLVLLVPALLAGELALLALAARDGWLRAKLSSQFATVRALPGIRRRRAEVQPQRRLSAAQFATHLVATLDSPFIGVDPSSLPARLQRLYWRLVLAVIPGAR